MEGSDGASRRQKCIQIELNINLMAIYSIARIASELAYFEKMKIAAFDTHNK